MPVCIGNICLTLEKHLVNQISKTAITYFILLIMSVLPMMFREQTTLADASDVGCGNTEMITQNKSQQICSGDRGYLINEKLFAVKLKL